MKVLRWIASILCFMFALFSLLLPDASASGWFGKVLNSIFAPGQFEPRVWEIRASIGFALLGLTLVVI